MIDKPSLIESGGEWKTVGGPVRIKLNGIKYYYMYYLIQALLTGEWQTVRSVVVKSMPYRSTTKVVCL